MAFVSLTTQTHKGPGTVGWANQVKENLDQYAAHTHDTTHGEPALAADTVGQSQIAASAVGQGELKTTASETSTTTSAVTITISTTYSFVPLIKGNVADDEYNFVDNDFFEAETVSTTYLTPTTSYARRHSMKTSGTGRTAYFYYRYVAASPPHLVVADDEPWWWFLWLLREKGSRKIHSAHCCDDPPWHFGHDDLPKDDPERVYRTPHPWVIDYPDPALLDAAGLEIVLVDTRALNAEADAPTLRRLQYESLVARRAERAALGLTVEQLDRAEEAAAVGADTKRMKGYEALRVRSDFGRRGVLELVHGDAAPVGAHELLVVQAKDAAIEIEKAKKDKMPRVPVGESKRAWNDVVKVLRA